MSAARWGPDVEHIPVTGPPTEAETDRVARRPRLVRSSITLDDGHRVGVAVSGHGLPLVVVHGYTAEGFLYAQTLSRLGQMGFKVVAIDTAGHGGTQGLPAAGGELSGYVDVLGRAIDALGIRHAVLAGHSMGGRLVADLAAQRPERTVAVLLLDAIVGDTWDRMVRWFRLAPAVMGGYAALLILDSVSPWAVVTNRQQFQKLGKLFGPTLLGHLRHPGRLVGPAVSILRSAHSIPALDQLRDAGVPVTVVHGALDLVVPMNTARDTVRRTHGQLVVVHRAGHSWLLKDPETLPAVVDELLAGRLGGARYRFLRSQGLDPLAATTADIEAACYEPDAAVLAITPDPGRTSDITVHHHHSRYRFSLEPQVSD